MSSLQNAAPAGWTEPAHMDRWLDPREAPSDFEISAREMASEMRVAVSGTPTIEQLVSTLHIFGIESEQSTKPVMLIDLRRLRTDYSRADLLRVGCEIACSFAHLRRLALLVQPHRVTGITERQARRAGIDMRVFDEEELAAAWLHCSLSPPGRGPVPTAPAR